MKKIVRQAEKSDLTALIDLYQKNLFQPDTCICIKTENALNEILSDSDSFLLVCCLGNKIVASCRLCVEQSLAFSGSKVAVAFEICYEKRYENIFDCLSLIISKVKEIAEGSGCYETIFLNENSSSFLNSVILQHGFSNTYCLIK